MLKEVIIVEGKSDIAVVKRAVEADIIQTGGFALNKNAMEKIRIAYEKRGIIILTDPDSAGERIRKKLTKEFPLALQAFIAKEDATANDDIGVEQASPEVIRQALAKVRTHVMQVRELFFVTDLFEQGLSGEPAAAKRRNELGKLLGLGYTNAKQFLRRLNDYGVTRAEFAAALKQLEDVE